MTTNPIITAEQLAKLAETTSVNCVIYDCRFSLANPLAGSNSYDNGHIPNAFYLDMENDLAGDKHASSGRHPLPNPATFQNKLQQCGVNTDTTIICYDDNRQAGSARLWWLLDYFGHQHIRILDGGFNAWQKAGMPVSTTQTGQKSPGNFQVQANPAKVILIDEIKTNMNNGKLTGLSLIDSRESERYQGMQEPIDPVAGHIPDAINFPWLEITETDGTIKPLAFHQQRWSSLLASSQQDSKPMTFYCGSGVTACVNLLSLHLAGDENGKLYPGSWSQWCADPDNPIA